METLLCEWVLNYQTTSGHVEVSRRCGSEFNDCRSQRMKHPLDLRGKGKRRGGSNDLKGNNN